MVHAELGRTEQRPDCEFNSFTWLLRTCRQELLHCLSFIRCRGAGQDSKKQRRCQLRGVAQLASSWVRSTRNFKPSDVAWVTLKLAKRRFEVSWTRGPRLEASRATLCIDITDLEIQSLLHPQAKRVRCTVYICYLTSDDSPGPSVRCTLSAERMIAEVLRC